MYMYYMNIDPQKNADYQVHKAGCIFAPPPENIQNLGEFSDSQSAVDAARMIEHKADGCVFCMPTCHTQGKVY
ncbi:hypothetical protein [Terasakiella sp.]|uniref:hypothetical protein n=1 Tax=Terasakiella sp. TaxID=2034861 RepID=UPI003AA9BAE7